MEIPVSCYELFAEFVVVIIYYDAFVEKYIFMF